MPASAARSEARGRPPFGFSGSDGRSGSITAHRSSGTRASIPAQPAHGGFVPRSKTFAPWERRQIRWLSLGMQAQRNRLLEALGLTHPLYERMEACGTLDDTRNNMVVCGVPLCPRCFMRRRAKETGRALKEAFVGLPNEKLAFLTLLLPPTADLGTVDESIAMTKRRIRNMIAHRRRQDPRWNAVQLTGWWEMDRDDLGSLSSFGRNKRIAMDAMGWPLMGFARTTVWRPHLHGIVGLGDVSREELAEALRAGGHDAPYQVDLKAFDAYRPVAMNIKQVIRYALKFRIERDYKEVCHNALANRQIDDDARSWWSNKDILSYVVWLMSRRGGFERIRFVVRPCKFVS